jgi:uncharacterized iron-regulated protein
MVLALPAWAAPPPEIKAIWSVAEKRPISADDLARRLLDAGVLILGETHDNPAHHAIQAWAVERLVQSGRRPVTAFEMVDTDRQPALDAALGDVDGLGAALDWDKRGWPAWSLYAPIAKATLAGGGGLFAANLPTALARDIAKGQESPDTDARFGLDEPLAAAAAAALTNEIKAGHCNMLPDTAIPAMVKVQRARDAAMAEVVADQAARPEVGPVVLIAGAGHGRADWAVPARLRAMIPGVKVLSVALLEADDGPPAPAAWLKERFGARSPYDLVIFTDRAQRDDPCKAMERHMHKSAPADKGQ